MTAKKAAGPAPRGEAPAEFRLNGLDDSVAVQEAIRALDGMEVDRSGFDKAIRAVKPVAWGAWCHGGSGTAARRELEQLRHRKAQAAGRLGGLKARHLPTDAAEAEIASIEANVARLEALVKAAGDGPDQRTRRDRLEAAERRLDDARARLEPYRAGRIPAPLDLEDALVAAEDALNQGEADFAAGRAELEKLTSDVRALAGKAYQALAASCATACAGLGSEARKLILPDLGRLLRLPHRAPAEIDGLYRRAAHLDSLMGKLGATPGRGLAAFWKTCSDCGPVVADRVGAVPARTRPRQHEAPALDVEARIGVT